jgi:hypothetical protein
MNECHFSPCRTFRYYLVHRFDESKPLLGVIGLNPSTADEQRLDPTLRKVRGFAQRLDCGGFIMLNLGAYRSTDPKLWRHSADPFGPENTVDHLQAYIDKFMPSIIVAAWGAHCNWGLAWGRAQEIKRSITELKCWGASKNGMPRHPLMLPYTTELQPYR